MKKLFVYDEDEIYLERLVQVLKKSDELNLEIHKVSSASEFIECTLQEDAIFMAHETIREEIEYVDDKFIYLTDRSSDLDYSESHTIYKYAGGDQLISLLVGITDVNNENQSGNKDKNKPVTTIPQHNATLAILFNPSILRSGTVTAIGLCRKSSVKTLYMNITSIPSYEKIGEYRGDDLLKLMYLNQNHKEIDSSLIKRCISKVDGVDCVNVGFYNMEYSVIKTEEWLNLFNSLKTICGYEQILVEMDAGIQCPIEIMKIAGSVYYYQGKASGYEIQKKVFTDILKKRKEFELIKNIKVILEQ